MIEGGVDFICRQIGFALRDFAVYAVDFSLNRAIFARKFFFGCFACGRFSLLLRCKRLGRLFGFGFPFTRRHGSRRFFRSDFRFPCTPGSLFGISQFLLRRNFVGRSF